MSTKYQLKEQTRQRCKIWPATGKLLSEFRILTMDHFHVFYESAFVDLSLFMLVGDELVEFIRPAEFKDTSLLDQIREVMAHDYNDVHLMLRIDDQVKYLNLQRQVQAGKVNALLQKDAYLDRKTIELFTDLSSASMLVVKGGLTEEVVSVVAQVSKKLIHNITDNNAVMATLSRMIHSDPTTYDHSASVAMIASIIATKVIPQRFTPELAEILATAGICHDVGKSAIPNAILNKPGKFEPAEFEIMKTHTTEGFDELNKVIGGGAPLPEIVARVALEHHEKFNGNGYPHNKKGRAEEDPQNGIHLFSRIITIADVYSALLMKRVYKPAYEAGEALKIMVDTAKDDYDPDIFIPFVREVAKSFNQVNALKKADSKGRIFSMDDGKLQVVGSGTKTPKAS